MSKRTIGIVALAATATLGAGTAMTAGASAKPHGGEPEPLDVLLTNDDGWIGAGGSSTPLIVALRDALRSAGHHVVVVAPGSNQSGQGGRFSLPPLQLELANPEPDVWTVTPGSPADSVYFALDEILADEPDLVISGMNPGNNMGTAVIHSGTVNAALTALELDLPSIAVSLGTSATWPAGATVAAPDAAQYVVDLVAELQRSSGGEELMPDGLSLNVNYPLLPGPADPGTGLPTSVEDPRGTLATSVDTAPFLAMDYVPVSGASGQPGTYSIALGGAAPSNTPGTDATAVAQGFVSISPLEVDHDVDAATARWVRRLTQDLSEG